MSRVDVCASACSSLVKAGVGATPTVQQLQGLKAPCLAFARIFSICRKRLRCPCGLSDRRMWMMLWRARPCAGPRRGHWTDSLSSQGFGVRCWLWTISAVQHGAEDWGSLIRCGRYWARHAATPTSGQARARNRKPEALHRWGGWELGVEVFRVRSGTNADLKR